MPQRVIQSQIVQHSVEFAFLCFSAVVATINSIIDEQSWDRLTGRHGALFVMAVGLLIFWNSNRTESNRRREALIRAETREDHRREKEEAERERDAESSEKRHRELIEIQERNASRLTALTVEQIKAQGVTVASINDLKRTIVGMPCAFKDDKQ